MITFSLGALGLKAVEVAALSSTCSVSRAGERQVAYTMHNWAATQEVPRLWVVDGDAPLLGLQPKVVSEKQFDGRAVWVGRAPWASQNPVMRRPMKWSTLLTLLDELAVSAGWITGSEAKAFSQKHNVPKDRQAIFLGKSLTVLAALEKELTRFGAYTAPTATEEDAIALGGLAHYSMAFLESASDGIDVMKACRTLKRDNLNGQAMRVILLAPEMSRTQFIKARMMGFDDVMPLPLDPLHLRLRLGNWFTNEAFSASLVSNKATSLVPA
jgi:CheY-like chemotaxis protein